MLWIYVRHCISMPKTMHTHTLVIYIIAVSWKIKGVSIDLQNKSVICTSLTFLGRHFQLFAPFGAGLFS
jgi:hypothetical protein